MLLPSKQEPSRRLPTTVSSWLTRRTWCVTFSCTTNTTRRRSTDTARTQTEANCVSAFRRASGAAKAAGRPGGERVQGCVEHLARTYYRGRTSLRPVLDSIALEISNRASQADLAPVAPVNLLFPFPSLFAGAETHLDRLEGKGIAERPCSQQGSCFHDRGARDVWTVGTAAARGVWPRVAVPARVPPAPSPNHSHLEVQCVCSREGRLIDPGVADPFLRTAFFDSFLDQSAVTEPGK